MTDQDPPQLTALKAALAASPENIPLLLLYGTTALDAWSLDEARDAFSRILGIQADHPEARLGIARTLFLAGKTSEAAVRMEQLTGELPDFAPAHLFLSRILAVEGNRDAATRHYNTAIGIDPTTQDTALASELDIPSEGNAPGDGNQKKGKLKDAGGIWHVEEDNKTPFAEEDDDYDEDEDENGLENAGDGIPDNLIVDREQPKISFAEVGGMEELKEQIRMKILYPMENPELFKAYGKKIGGGVLLYGPPGCGKTLIARATAGEIKANFFPIGLHEVLDAFIGESEKRLHSIFETARNNAPAVLFFDEIDALAADRRDLRQSAGRNVINQFLSELDGGDDANDGVLVLGATNAPWHIDPAFRRPGRFDRTVFVPPPDEIARQAIIGILAEGKPVGELDAAALAKKTKDFSGADLKAVFDTATEAALERAMKEGRVVPLGTKALAKAARTNKPTTRAWFDSAKNYALYANQGGFYDEVLQHLGIKPS